jgi:uncharacterized protein (TIGR03663 family)
MVKAVLRHVRSSCLDRELIPYLVLAAMALGMRLWDVGSRAVSHDESLHLFYSWGLSQGNGYEHNPLMHGPFQFFGNALNFIVFGDSDFTARLLPALFGAALVLLPFFLRQHLGRWGGITVAILLTFSPTLLYFSRYARNDIYIAFWMLLLVICLWRYIAERKARYLYLGAAALSLSFSTKEVMYITVPIFASFLLIVAGKGLVIRIGKKLDLSGLPPAGEYLILIGTLVLPLFGAFIELIPGVDLAPGVTWHKVLTVGLLLIVSAAIGLRWNVRRWLFSALIFWGIFALLYTTYFTNIPGFGSGIWGSVEYWVEQQDVARGNQPLYYYIVLLSFYEFLTLALGAIGAIYFTIKGDLFSRFLVYWAALSLLLFTLFGERMPWLSVHIVLPAILLSGKFIEGLFRDVGWRRVRASALRAVTVLILIFLFSFTVHIALEASYDKDDEPPQMLVYAGISSEVPQIMAQIERVAEETGEGKGLLVTIDDGLTWPWAWYLRDFNIEYANLSSIDGPPAGTVLLLSASNEQAAEPHLDKYGEGQRFRQLLWFPEEYRDFDFFGSDSWRWWWNYLLHRTTEGPYWSTQGIAYFPESTP